MGESATNISRQRWANDTGNDLKHMQREERKRYSAIKSQVASLQYIISLSSNRMLKLFKLVVAYLLV